MTATKWLLITIFFGSGQVSVQTFPDQAVCNGVLTFSIPLQAFAAAAENKPAPIMFCAQEYQPPVTAR